MQGAREWTDYHVRADITPHLARSAGIDGRPLSQLITLTAH
jgi:hypothetical protein